MWPSTSAEPSIHIQTRVTSCGAFEQERETCEENAIQGILLFPIFWIFSSELAELITGFSEYCTWCDQMNI